MNDSPGDTTYGTVPGPGNGEDATAPGLPAPSAMSWVAPVAANLVLGCLAVLPFNLVWAFLADYPLAAAGLTSREPTDNDGITPWLLVLAVVLGVLVPVWVGLNRVLNRRGGLPGRRYWPVCVAVLLAPTTVLAVFPGAWQALEGN